MLLFKYLFDMEMYFDYIIILSSRMRWGKPIDRTGDMCADWAALVPQFAQAAASHQQGTSVLGRVESSSHWLSLCSIIIISETVIIIESCSLCLRTRNDNVQDNEWFLLWSKPSQLYCSVVNEFDAGNFALQASANIC